MGRRQFGGFVGWGGHPCSAKKNETGKRLGGKRVKGAELHLAINQSLLGEERIRWDEIFTWRVGKKEFFDREQGRSGKISYSWGSLTGPGRKKMQVLHLHGSVRGQK